MENFIYPGLLSSVALLVYYFTLLQAGLARAKYDIKAPSHDGPEEYVRKVRVHHNTIEHLVLFLPGLWLFSFAVDPIWAFIIGIVWPIGRIKYALDYYKDAEKKRSWFIFQYATNIYLCSWIINWFYYKNRFVKSF